MKIDWAPLINTAIQYAAPLAVTAITGILASAGLSLRKFLERKATDAHNSTLIKLAGMAVGYAEDHFGPDTAKGQEKQDAAVAFVMKNLKGVDEATARTFVKGAYTAAFGSLAPLSHTGAASAPLSK